MPKNTPKKNMKITLSLAVNIYAYLYWHLKLDFYSRKQPIIVLWLLGIAFHLWKRLGWGRVKRGCLLHLSVGTWRVSAASRMASWSSAAAATGRSRSRSWRSALTLTCSARSVSSDTPRRLSLDLGRYGWCSVSTQRLWRPHLQTGVNASWRCLSGVRWSSAKTGWCVWFLYSLWFVWLCRS